MNALIMMLLSLSSTAVRVFNRELQATVSSAESQSKSDPCQLSDLLHMYSIMARSYVSIRRTACSVLKTNLQCLWPDFPSSSPLKSSGHLWVQHKVAISVLHIYSWRAFQLILISPEDNPALSRQASCKCLKNTEEEHMFLFATEIKYTFCRTSLFQER